MKTRLAGKRRAKQDSHPGRDERRKRAKEHEKHAKHKRRRKHRKPKHHSKPHGTLGLALPVAPVAPPAPSPAPVPAVGSPPITLAQAHRLLWRAGFGPTSGQAEALAGQPLDQVVYGLTRPSGPATLSGPEAVDDEGNQLEPADAWGQDHCWWLDRMVRSDQQLVERLTFIFHDWFANSNEKVNNQHRCSNRTNCFARWRSAASTTCSSPSRPTRRCSCSSTESKTDKDDPNENYAREMMELFSLGADRGAYTEDDVREMARALTGWTAEWSPEAGPARIPLRPRAPRQTTKRRYSGRRATGTTKTPFAYASNIRCTPRSS